MTSELLNIFQKYHLKRRFIKLKNIIFFRPDPTWIKEIKAIDTQFDRDSGFDSGGVVELKKLTISGTNKEFGHRHIAIRPNEFDAAFQALPFDVSGFTFIDIGSGKGRALILAARHSFKKIIGVEFAKELHLAAQANAKDFNSRITNLWMDATKYNFPAGPLVIYLYNPFGAFIMDQVAERASLATGPVFVMYLNAFEEKSWTNCGFSRIAHGPTFSILELNSTRPAQRKLN